MAPWCVAVIGSVVAARVQMTAMPQLGAALHSFVGMAAVLVAIGTFINRHAAGTLNPVLMGELSAGIVIGAITFSGSVVAFAKLQGLVSGAPVRFAGQHALNAEMALATIALVFLLSIRLRRAEIQTMIRIGAAPGRVAAILGTEILLVLIASLLMAGLLTGIATAFGDEIFRWLLQSGVL